MKAVSAFIFSFLACVTAIVTAAMKPTSEDSTTVTVSGILRTGVVAIGGETTGTTVTVEGITWELEFGKNEALAEAAKKLDGKKVVVKGTLERRPGVEVKGRRIVTVSELRAAGDGDQ